MNLLEVGHAIGVNLVGPAYGVMLCKTYPENRANRKDFEASILIGAICTNAQVFMDLLE